VTNSSFSSYGLNVAATGGSFDAGSGLKVESGELTHDGTQTVGTFSFDWTAPLVPGTYTLSGVGNAVNGNRLPGGDAWNVARDLTITVCADDDLDGVDTCSGDCDDNDGTVYPGAPEVCDGFDQNCDGEADDGLPVTDFYVDDDGDDYGAGSVVFSDCDDDAPFGFAGRDGDCDDEDSSVYPGAPETWYDGVDSDCADDSDFDQDQDGFDSEAQAEGGTDCDDADPAVNPDAEEVQGDGIDQDCDGADGGSGSGSGSGSDSDSDSDSEDAAAADAEGGKTGGGCATASAPMALGGWAALVAVGLLRRRRAD